MSTPHIDAQKGDFAEVVIMPGDPLRAKYIAENYLKNSIQVNTVRSMLGFTGFFKNKRVSVMSHGMGIPSSVIYVRELISEFGVKKIIRVGTCGAVLNSVDLNDVVIGMGACTDSRINRLRFGNHDFSAIADYDTLSALVLSAKKINTAVKVGNFFTTDSFYSNTSELLKMLVQYNILAVEMETSGIYSIAAELNAKAVSICTVTDHLITHNKLSVKDREKSCNKMIEIALNSIV
ncbi:Purine nucleoside phosphorylase DeoD-type [Buchnera aphidicola (Anoecia corni)]|uniref:Purine nucleoside phosphorylase DeoD-type n=1 Tax=Buchnera aphidicola (Anoecia corni) TaxID=2994477 RepID=A0AAT9IH43_9GAMM